MVTVGVTVTPLFAQTQNTTASTSTSYIQTSKLIGTTVKSSQGETIGEIKDVVLDNNGCMVSTIVSTGGAGSRITGQSKTVAVPWAVYSTTSDPRVVTVSVEKEKIYNAPVFEYSRINEYSTSGWINNVYSHYGVSANVGVGTQSSVTGTTTTGAATTTTAGSTITATASPATSPLPTASATASPAVSASPSATASASAYPTATASPTGTMSARPGKPTRGESSNREEPPSGKASVTPSSSSHHHTGTAATEKSEESKSESTSSPSSGKKKSSRKSATEESTEPSATPKVGTEQE